jgi:hypothetical protein
VDRADPLTAPTTRQLHHHQHRLRAGLMVCNPLTSRRLWAGWSEAASGLAVQAPERIASANHRHFVTCTFTCSAGQWATLNQPVPRCYTRAMGARLECKVVGEIDAADLALHLTAGHRERIPGGAPIGQRYFLLVFKTRRLVVGSPAVQRALAKTTTPLPILAAAPDFTREARALLASRGALCVASYYLDRSDEDLGSNRR